MFPDPSHQIWSVIIRRHFKPLVYLGLQMVGRCSGFHNNLHPILPCQQLRPGPSSKKANHLPHHRMVPGRPAADCPNPAWNYIVRIIFCYI